MLSLFLVLLVLFSAISLGYPALMYLLHLRTRSAKDHPLFHPCVSIVIPTIAGGKIMERKLENISALRYPSEKLEVIVVDSSENPFQAPKDVEIIHQERMGKPAALNLGIEASSNDIIVITDDDAVLDPDALTLLTSCFSDPEIGGVVGHLTLGGKKILNKMNSSFYGIFRNSLRKQESSLDSVSFTSGELFSFRKSIISHVDESMISDDLYLLFEIRKKGYRVVSSEAEVFEEDVPSLRGQINHKRRTMIGTLQVFSKNLRILLNPQYGLFGSLIAPAYLLRIALCPFLLLFLECLVFFYFPTLLPILIFAAAFLALVKRDLFMAMIYAFLVQASALLGVIDFLTGNYTVLWKRKGK